MYKSIPSLTIPRATPGDSHILVAPGVGFSLLCLARGSARGQSPGGLNQSKSSIILKKARFLLCLLNRQVAALLKNLFMLEVSSVTLIGPIYTITNTQRIRIYPGKLKFVLVKISPDPGHLHGKHTKESQTLFTFLTTAILSGLPCSHDYKYGA